VTQLSRQPLLEFETGQSQLAIISTIFTVIQDLAQSFFLSERSLACRADVSPTKKCNVLCDVTQKLLNLTMSR
jgi:hypothetical protein